jgi:probable HAF family extracellular repeat protein
VAGTSEGDNGMEAFKWTSSEGMIGLGDLPGGEYFSSALDVSNDGDKIAGFSSVGTDIYEAFKWTSEEGMTGLGRPSASESSLAMSISGDGNVVVGAMGDLESKNLNAFRWDLVNGMQKVTSWLTTTGASVPSALSLDIATSTNEDGSVVGGMSDGSAWLAFSGRGVVFPDTYTPTLVIPKISSQASFQLLDLSLEGSHHLPLKTMLKSKDKCFWANGDWSDKETKNTYSKLFEIGSCLDIDSDIRVGLGLGKSMSKKSIANEISSKIDGKYLYSGSRSEPLFRTQLNLS